MIKADPYFAPDLIRQRQAARVLDKAGTQAFLEACEVISIGNFCGVSCAIKALGLRKSANPFDWVRSPVEGIIHCFDRCFEDFLTFTSTAGEGHGKAFLGTRWGGSFWHHDIESPKVREDFTRRIERLLGLGKVPACT